MSCSFFPPFQCIRHQLNNNGGSAVTICALSVFFHLRNPDNISFRRPKSRAPESCKNLPHNTIPSLRHPQTHVAYIAPTRSPLNSVRWQSYCYRDRTKVFRRIEPSASTIVPTATVFCDERRRTLSIFDAYAYQTYTNIQSDDRIQPCFIEAEHAEIVA